MVKNLIIQIHPSTKGNSVVFPILFKEGGAVET